VPYGAEANSDEMVGALKGLKRRTRLVRKNKNHLRFPLYTDDQIGFTTDNKLVTDSNLVEADADEDYETDDDILRRTIAVCKKDVLFALRKIKVAPSLY